MLSNIHSLSPAYPTHSLPFGAARLLLVPLDPVWELVRTRLARHALTLSALAGSGSFALLVTSQVAEAASQRRTLQEPG